MGGADRSAEAPLRWESAKQERLAPLTYRRM